MKAKGYHGWPGVVSMIHISGKIQEAFGLESGSRQHSESCEPNSGTGERRQNHQNSCKKWLVTGEVHLSGKNLK